MPATLQSPGEHQPLDNTMGAILVGILVSAVLYGISLVQTFFYYNHYRNDAWYLKSLVAATVFFDTMHLCFITHTSKFWFDRTSFLSLTNIPLVYFYLVSRYYDNEQLNDMIWSVLAEAIPTGFTGTLVQTFYTIRVWRLSKKNHVLAVVIMSIVLAQTGDMWYCMGHYIIATFDVPAVTRHFWFDSVHQRIILGSRHVLPLIRSDSLEYRLPLDVIIAASLCFLLTQSRTGFKHSDTLINKLILFSVNTGLATSICAVASLVSLIASPDSLLYAPFYFCIGRLYSNSLLATLNARKQIRNSSNDNEHMMVSLSQASREQTALPTIPKVQRPQNIAIRIDTAKEYASDRKMDENSDITFE
ncbi:hypothetical protein DFJ43DRAFT_1159097 [Lentinula guzmanii]|uniref:DUF6534 domain-containing protein n=1 Tax=Lentinula guzmanii TaxID=2804957 RepID=A0AA38JC63_9AGAR|nr:hypothetical protein DFJ43DRAFT_1159097 [Lentinula guzmanii]